MRIVLDGASRGLAQSLASRWKKTPAEIHVLEDGIASFSRLLDRDEAEIVVLSSLSSVMLFDVRDALQARGPGSADVVKLSIERTPVETYLLARGRLLELLEAAAARGRPASAVKDFLFQGVLFGSIDLIEDVPGQLLFQNDLMEYYRRNLWLATNAASEEYSRAASRLPELADALSEARITEQGFLKDSYIAPGAEVEGYVCGSVIFPRVVVRHKAEVVNSVIGTNNRVGAGSTIQNAMVLPYMTEGPRNAPNLADGCSVGSKTSGASNERFPDQIRDGVAVVGMNVSLPAGFRAEGGTCIGADVTASMLRRQKSLRRGGSFFEDGREWSSSE